MYTLYIDTHYIKLQLVLFKNGKVEDEIIKSDGKHSSYLVSSLKLLLERNRVNFDDLDSIIVINGPGSFTGVRLGIVVAKMVGFCKGVPIKVLSYLQAVALKYDKEVMIGIKDKNGVFGGKFNNRHELVGDYFYINNKDINSYKDILIDDEVLLDKVYNFMLNKRSINPHVVKPIYVKKIEVDK